MKTKKLHTPHWRHLLLLLVCLTSIGKGHAQYYQFQTDYDEHTIYFTARGTGATVVSGDKKYSGNVNIPATVSYEGMNFSVVSIGSFAFSECSDLNSVNLPKTLLSIGSYAFHDCASLKSIIIPNSVTTIGSNAFDGCSNLINVTLSNSLKAIENYSFYNCRNLRAIDIPSSVRKIGKMAFQNCLLLSSATLPNSITSIESFAFDKCINLKNLTIPNQLTFIEQYTFSGCSRLETIEIPNSVTAIDEWAFYDCDGLKSITIPNSVSYIGEWAFTNCKAIETINSKIENPFSIGKYVFERSVKANAKLLIPTGTKEAYLNTSGWDFENIIEEMTEPYHLVMWAKDGTKIAEFALDEKPKVTFNNNSYVVSSIGADIISYDLERLARFTYEKADATVMKDMVNENTSFRIDGETLLFPSLKSNSIVSFYSVNGTLVFNKRIAQHGRYAFPISNLSPGIYIIQVNGSTYKIVKK